MNAETNETHLARVWLNNVEVTYKYYYDLAAELIEAQRNDMSGALIELARIIEQDIKEDKLLEEAQAVADASIVTYIKQKGLKRSYSSGTKYCITDIRELDSGYTYHRRYKEDKPDGEENPLVYSDGYFADWE